MRRGKRLHQCPGAQGWVSLPPSLGPLGHQGCSCIAPKKQHPNESQQEVGTMAGCLAHSRHRFLRPREAPPPPCVRPLPAVPWHRGSRPALSWLPASHHSTRERGSAFLSPLTGIWVRSCPPQSPRMLCALPCAAPPWAPCLHAAGPAHFGGHRSAQSTSVALS